MACTIHNTYRPDGRCKRCEAGDRLVRKRAPARTTRTPNDTARKLAGLALHIRAIVPRTWEVLSSPDHQHVSVGHGGEWRNVRSAQEGREAVPAILAAVAAKAAQRATLKAQEDARWAVVAPVVALLESAAAALDTTMPHLAGQLAVAAQRHRFPDYNIGDMTDVMWDRLSRVRTSQDLAELAAWWQDTDGEGAGSAAAKAWAAAGQMADQLSAPVDSGSPWRKH